MKVVVYSTPTCPWCDKAKQFLKKHRVRFEEKDVSKDEKAREEMVDKSGQLAVPVIEINGHIVVGFDEGKIRKLLNL